LQKLLCHPQATPVVVLAGAESSAVLAQLSTSLLERGPAPATFSETPRLLPENPPRVERGLRHRQEDVHTRMKAQGLRRPAGPKDAP
jgi:hypothetical protein